MQPSKLFLTGLIILHFVSGWSQCELYPISLGEYICDDNGTPDDPSDDTFTFEVIMDNNDLGTTYNAFNGTFGQNGTYGVPLIIGPLDVSGAPYNINFIDDDNPNCTYSIYVDPGENCENTICAIYADFGNYVCDDNGTPTDPTDDTFIVDLTVIGINTSPSWTCTGFIEDSGPYGTQTYGPFTVYTGVTGVEVVDDGNPNCIDYATLFSPGPCSNGCIITNVFVSSVTCDDNGTPDDPDDDVVLITIFPLGSNLGTSYTVSTDVGMINGTVGLFDEFTDFEISDFLPATEITVTVTADDDPTCTFDFVVEVPDGCGQLECALTDPGLISFTCNDFGTPGIGADDYIDFIINPIGLGLGSNFIVTSPSGVISPGFGTYGMDNPQSIQGISVDPGDPIIITITDADDPNCSINFEIENITPCIAPCTITDINISDIECFTNGTSTQDDDVYTFFVFVEGTDLGSGWTADDPFNNFGDYNTLVMFGPFLIADGPLTITITDNEDPNCTFTFEIQPPEPCSSGCTIEAEISNITCDDNGTPNDPDDDTFTFDVLVTGSGNSWIATDPNLSSGDHDVVTTLGPYPINLGDLSFAFFDEDDSSCFIELTVNAPPPCSEPVCDIDAAVSNILCDDNGTPNDPDDDTFTFDVIVSGTNTGPSWTANDPDNSSGPYNQAFTFGPFLISDGNVSFTITDVDDVNCTTLIDVTPPAPCSVPVCDITTVVSNILCDDNGTPNDPDDDTFTFDVVLSGTNTGPSWTADDPDNSSGPYDQVFTFGPFLISDGNVSFTITDVDDLNCTASIDVTPPAPCSDPLCNITADVSNILCNDNGTPNDPDDDTFTFDVVVSGSNNGPSWTADDPGNSSGPYDQVFTFGPFLISDGNVSFTITDVDDLNCTASIDVTPPAPCSDPLCNITADVSNILCNDNGTLNDPDDDTFTFDLVVSGNNTGPSWTADDPDNSSGPYDQVFTFGPFLISDGNVIFTISDVDDVNCTTSIDVTPPAPCSDPLCNITADVSNILCDDNDTPNDPDDDTFTFDVIVSGNNTGPSWTADDPDNSSGPYDQIFTFGPFLISDGNVIFTISDVDDLNCTTSIDVTPPAPCSDPLCNIIADVSNILCDDNDTPNDPDDDTFTFDVIVSGNNTGPSWTADDLDNSSGTYDQVFTFGPFLISDGNVSFTVTDIDDLNCTTSIDVTPPAPCSDPLCNITADVSNILCNDNGTPVDPDDDTFTFDVVVSGNNTGPSWTADDPDNSSGPYDQIFTFGPFLISDGNVSFTISDVDDLNCTTSIDVTPPAPCSLCPPIDTTFINEISCNLDFEPIEINQLVTGEGCDSIVVISTQYMPLESQVDTAVCRGDIWLLSGDVLLNDTILIDTISQSDCDIFTTFIIKVISPIEENLTFDLCTGQSVVIGGVTYDQSNPTGTNIIAGQDGCDSLIQIVNVSFSEFDIDVQVSDVICFEDNNGWIDISGTESPPLNLILNGIEYSIDALPFMLEDLGPDDYDLTISNAFGCSRQFQFEIREGELITLELDGSLMGGSMDSILLEANSNVDSGTYSWTTLPTDTMCMNCPIIISTFDSDFIYSVEISSENGCIAKDELALVLEKEVELYIPNVFSPNGDNANDNFVITNYFPDEISQLRLRIFDRWGNVVFYEEDSNSVIWDGTYNGKALQPAVFVYTLEILFNVGNSEFRSGDITLLR